MNATRRSVALCLASALGVSAAQVQADDALSRLAWLSGCWVLDGREAGTVEMWTPPAGGTMLGAARTVRGARTVDFEFMQIRLESDGSLVFIAQPSGGEPTAFRAVSLTGDEVVFENRQHDFPQRIIYRRVAPDALHARVEGDPATAPRAFDFPMRRTSCGPEPDA